MAVQVGAVLLATQACAALGPCALQPLAGRPALAHLLDVLSTSHRLRPLPERLVIVASAETAADVCAWAERRGLGACVCVAAAAPGGGGRGGAPAPAAALGAALQHPGLAGATHVVVADGGQALEPNTSIARMVEAAVVQAAAMTAGVCIPLKAPPEAARLLRAPEGAAEVELQARAQQAGSRVTAVRAAGARGAPAAASPAGAAAGAPPPPRAATPPWARQEHAPAPVLAPLCVLTRRALREAAEAAEAGGEGPTLARLCGRLLDTGEAVRSWPLEAPLDLSTPEAARMADAFFLHYGAIHQRLCWELQQAACASTRSGAGDPQPEVLARCTLVQLEERLNRMGISQATAFMGQLRPPGGDCEPYGGFRPVFEHWLGSYLAGLDSRAANPFVKDYKHLPDRFKDATSFAHRPRKEHACYTTSAAEYGAKRATALNMPLSWAGIHGRFTNTFCGGPALSSTFKTHNIRSRVHRALDEL